MTREAARTLGRRWVDTVLKAPVVFVLLVVGLLGAAAIPAASLDLNLPGGRGAGSSLQREAYDMIAAGFGEGYNGLLIVTVDITQTTDILDDLDAIAARLADVDGGVRGRRPAERDGRHRDHPGRPRERAHRPGDQAGRPGHPRVEDEILADFGTPIAVTGYTAVRSTSRSASPTRSCRSRSSSSGSRSSCCSSSSGRCSCRSRPRWASCSRRSAPSA